MQNGGVGHVTSDRLDTEGTKPGSDSIGTRERPDVALAHQQRGHDRCTKTIACGVAQVADVLVTGDVKYEVARHHPSREPSRSASYPSTADSYLRAAWSVTARGMRLCSVSTGGRACRWVFSQTILACANMVSSLTHPYAWSSRMGQACWQRTWIGERGSGNASCMDIGSTAVLKNGVKIPRLSLGVRQAHAGTEVWNGDPGIGRRRGPRRQPAPP